MTFVLSCYIQRWGAGFGYNHYISLFCVYSGLTDVPKQAVANAVPAKWMVSFMIGLKWEVFIYFAVIFWGKLSKVYSMLYF